MLYDTSSLMKCISIHALLAESDPVCHAGDCTATYFYPRSPCGERQPSLYQLYDTYAISIHALLAESDALIHWKHS